MYNLPKIYNYFKGVNFSLYQENAKLQVKLILNKSVINIWYIVKFIYKSIFYLFLRQ